MRLRQCLIFPDFGLFQSTHSLRSATELLPDRQLGGEVSIHALLAECDRTHCYRPANPDRFNPRTPCGVRLLRQDDQLPVKSVSIHALLAECDQQRTQQAGRYAGFNPRTPCGVRLWVCRPADAESDVSIHALLAECDGYCGHIAPKSGSFNPRTPCGVRLLLYIQKTKVYEVSIHALLAECDFFSSWERKMEGCFNPRTPCGVRLVCVGVLVHGKRFQSTHSLRSATRQECPECRRKRVSIHALLAECDDGPGAGR